MDCDVNTCHACGQCCRLAKIWWAAAGIPWREGYVGMACAQLDQETNRCRIYERRPAVCRIETARAAGLDETTIWLLQPCSQTARIAPTSTNSPTMPTIKNA
jgi:Fe-S-cluster containining protein